MAIKSFGDQTTSDIYHGIDSKAARRIPKEIWPSCRRKLAMLHNAKTLQDLRIPGLNLEDFKYDRPGYWSIRVDLRYRIFFMWIENNAYNVTTENYHGRKTS